jgi:hypothetical protein
MRQWRKRIADKYADGDEISDEDQRELWDIWMWSHHRRDREKIHAKLIGAVKEIADEIIRRSREIDKLERDLIQYVRDKFQ